MGPDGIGANHEMLRLHHIGYVVASVRACGGRVAASIAGKWNEELVHDPIQGADVAFIEPACPGQPLIELVEPSSQASRVAPFLQRGGGLHHLCYEVDSIDEQLEYSRAKGGTVVQRPVPAVAFHGRRIAWFFTREKLLIEFLERERPLRGEGADA